MKEQIDKLKFPDIPNLPKLFGKGIGKLLHVPFDVVTGVKEGFLNEPEVEPEKTKE